MAKEYVKQKDLTVQGGFYFPDVDHRGIAYQGLYKTTDFDEASKYLDPSVESLVSFATFPMSRIDPGGTYRFGSGNVGAPGISWVADTDTGEYLIGVGNPAEAVNGALVYDWTSSRMKFATSFYLQLGPTHPIFPNIGEELISAADSFNGPLRFALKNTSAGTSAHVTLSAYSDEGNDCSMGIANTSYAAGTLAAGEGFLIMNTGAGGGPGGRGMYILNALNSYLRFGTNGSERYRLDSTGKLGGNTTTPRKLLDLLDTTAAQLRLTYTDNSVYCDLQVDSGGDLTFTPSGGDVNVTGNVNITQNYLWKSGTSFFGTFDHAITAARTWTFPDITGTVLTTATASGLFTQGSVIFADSAGQLTQDNANFFWDDTNNRLGIGTTGPDRPLDVLSTAGPQARLTYTDGSVYSDFQVDSSGYLTISPTGLLTSLPTSHLGVLATAKLGPGIYVENANSTGIHVKAGSASNTRSMMVFQQSSGSVTSALNATGAFYTNQFITISGTFAATLNADDSLATFTTGASGLSTMVDVVSDVQFGIVSKAYNSSTPVNFQGLDNSGNYTFAVMGDGSLQWGAGATLASMDLIVSRNAANVLQIKNGTSACGLFIWGTTTGSKYISLGHDGSNGNVYNNASSGHLIIGATSSVNWQFRTTGHLIPSTDDSYDLGISGTTRPRQCFLSSPAVTQGSGTGVTVNDQGSVRKIIYKVTTTFAAFAAAAGTANVTICTLPAKTKVTAVYADTTTKYVGGAVTATTLTLGITGGGTELIASHDVFTAAVTKGLADADMGTQMTRAAAIQGGYLPSFTATTTLVAQIATTTANTNALTQGSTTWYVETVKLQ